MIPLWADSNNWATLKETTNQAITMLNSMVNAIVPIGVALPWKGNPNDPTLFDINGIGVAGSTMERFALCYGQGVAGSLMKNYDGTPSSTTLDLKNRFVYGFDPATPSMGSTGGQDVVTLTAAQSGLREHQHVQNIATAAGGESLAGASPTGSVAAFTTGVKKVDGVAFRDGPQDALSSHNNMPPFIVSAYIMRYK